MTQKQPMQEVGQEVGQAVGQAVEQQQQPQGIGLDPAILVGEYRKKVEALTHENLMLKAYLEQLKQEALLKEQEINNSKE